MIFCKRTPGETVVINTPTGEIVIRVLDGDELGIEVPPGALVREVRPDTAPANWLPSRPRHRVA